MGGLLLYAVDNVLSDGFTLGPINWTYQAMPSPKKPNVNRSYWTHREPVVAACLKRPRATGDEKSNCGSE